MIKIDIIGNGSVEITESDDSVTFYATPVIGYDFKHYVIGGNEVKVNPYSFDKVEDLTGEAIFYESINSTLRNCIPGIDVSGLIPAILRRRKVNYGEDVNDISEQSIELCIADMYYDSTNMPSSKQNHKDSDGGWSHDGGGFTMDASTKNSLVAKALTIYDKYGDERANEVKQANEAKRVIVEYLSSKAADKAPEKEPVNAIINFL